MKRVEIGDTVTFKGEVVDIVDDLIHFEGPTVRIWRGDSRIIDAQPPASYSKAIENDFHLALEKQKSLIRKNYPYVGSFAQSLILCSIMRLYGLQLT